MKVFTISCQIVVALFCLSFALSCADNSSSDGVLTAKTDALTDDGELVADQRQTDADDDTAVDDDVVPDWTYIGSVSNLSFGASIAEAGDVNNDGFGDIIVGSEWITDTSSLSRAYIFDGAAAGLVATPSQVLEYTASVQQFYYLEHLRVSSAGDVNNDGFADVIVGTPWYTEAANSGIVWVHFGSAGGVSASPSWTKSDVPGCFGTNVASAGDVNDDGFDDIIVSASNVCYTQQFPANETVYGYYGDNTKLPSTEDWKVEQPAAGFQCFGCGLSSAGDVNGDGYADVIVGAPNYTNVEEWEGAAYVYYGSNSGLSTTADWFFEADTGYAFFGTGVASAGDVNDDGYDDVLVGAPGIRTLYLFYGSATGLSATPDWTWVNTGNGDVGRSVDTAGDFDGDGYADVITGGLMPMKQFIDGYAFMFFGSATGPGSTPDWNTSGEGWFANQVSTAGDVNNDGLSDVIISAPAFTVDQNNPWVGAVYAYYGACAGCLIDSICYQSGDTNPDNVCLFCDTEQSTTDWSYNNQASCDDGVDCTENDVCSDGVCAGVPNDSLCDDQNPCTDDSCDTSDGCQFENNSATCDDGVYCNGNDICSGGDCAIHGGDPCDVQCQSCNEEMAVCDNVEDSCDDGVFCNGVDTCSDGECADHAGNPCPDDTLFCDGTESCDETNQQCVSSGDPCDADETCDETNDQCVSQSDDDATDDDTTPPTDDDVAPSVNEPDQGLYGGSCGF